MNDCDAPELMTVGEVASLLRVPRARVYKLITTHRLPSPVRIGKHIRLSRGKLLAFIERGGVALTTTGPTDTIPKDLP